MNQLAVIALAIHMFATASYTHERSSQEVRPLCPSAGDTLSLLQPSDSAFADARALAAQFDRAGLSVRCITRSVWTSLAGVGKVAGLQTARGTITVFFVPSEEHFELKQRPTRRGYQLTYIKDGPHPARTVLSTDAKRPVAWIARDGRYFQVMEPALAREVQRIAGPE